ncbi:hypothetical protein FN846DRAFT_524506 [Sphaerosporella brunnea]|uniref:Uncharacterized protein n=1 Tax=Sphaerosporella brunnea TaxID=1250544 RepID=A0A5J5EFF1_9PEZI|nr:hypothetical protein FN846DRAFT_524506 [Sphaerosporella brunnea]
MGKDPKDTDRRSTTLPIRSILPGYVYFERAAIGSSLGRQDIESADKLTCGSAQAEGDAEHTEHPDDDQQAETLLPRQKQHSDPVTKPVEAIGGRGSTPPATKMISRYDDTLSKHSIARAHYFTQLVAMLTVHGKDPKDTALWPTTPLISQAVPAPRPTLRPPVGYGSHSGRQTGFRGRLVCGFPAPGRSTTRARGSSGSSTEVAVGPAGDHADVVAPHRGTSRSKGYSKEVGCGY